ncbi:hypothetical protein Bbelb_411380 [Branchiostoma belcheri]|nr:hypothetical protein Bbelb_411380 [Branchiostoma belcheri]
MAASIYRQSVDFLRNVRRSMPVLEPWAKKTIKESLQLNGLLKMRSKPRGRKAGRGRVRKIPAIAGHRPPSGSFICKFYQQSRNPQQTCRNVSNLVSVSLQQLKRKNSPCLPSVYMCNARSLLNKLDEFELTLQQYKVDIAIVTETWFSTAMPSEFLNVDNYTLFATSRTDRRGGGVAIYTHENVQARPIFHVQVPPELECMWAWVRPKRLPREVPSIALCATYSPPNSKHQELLIDHLVNTADLLKTFDADVGLILAGDYNRLDYKPLVLSHRLEQVVPAPTRGDATLDVIVTNLKSFYLTPEVMNPLGTNDHKAVWWQSRVRTQRPNQTKHVVVRPLPDSRIRAFGQWITSHTWDEVLQSDTVEEKTAAFFRTLNCAIENYFPLRKCSLHHRDKPWITALLKDLIHRRQQAHSKGHMVLYRFLRNKVDRECKRVRKEFYNDQVARLKRSDPSEWHKQVRQLANLSKPTSTVHVPGVDPSDTSTCAGAINTHLATICKALPPLDMDMLPAFLPATPPPQVDPWQMYQRLKTVKVNKAPGPDAIPTTLIREFACELATPLTDITNASLQQGRVPPEWRDAIVIPVPKEQPGDLDKIRPVSLTSLFAKVVEGSVLSWLLRDILPMVDTRQFGNLRGISTAHCLIEIMDFFYKGSERKQSVSSLVLTDFSKAFDRVCHTTAITKLIQMGARSSLLPWHALSHWESLTCGVAEGTLLGPLLFLVMINDAGTTNSEYWKYVDDLNMGESRLAYSPSTLQNDLDSSSASCSSTYTGRSSSYSSNTGTTTGSPDPVGSRVGRTGGQHGDKRKQAPLPIVQTETGRSPNSRPHHRWLPPTRGDPYGRQLRNSLQYSQARRTKRYTTSAKPMLAKLTSHTEVALQRLVSRLGDACKEFGLTISLKKPNIMGQDVSSLPNKSIGDYTLEVVGDFTYLGSTITRNLSLDVELDKRFGKAATVLARLAKTV